VRTPFRAIARVVVPEMAEMDAMAWEEAEAIIEAGVRDRPAAMKRQLRLFIRVIQLLPIFRYGRPFTRLSRGQGERVLRWLEGSRLFLLRRGFWGLRTLVFMGYYGQDRTRVRLGYQADPRGWEARRRPEGPPAEVEP
jgi:hypothetical protein